jgi:YVTN family beta-propeller protein
MSLNRDASVSVIDPVVGITGITSLYANIRLKRPGADWAKTASEQWLYVTMPRAGEVALVNLENFKVDGHIAAGEGPTRVALQPDEKYLWVGNNARAGTSGGVTVIDTQSRQAVATIQTGSGHHEIAFSDDSRYVFVSNRDGGTVSVIDAAAMKKVRDIETGGTPISLAVSQLSRSLYIADGQTGVITVVDRTSLEIAARIRAHHDQVRAGPDALFRGWPLGCGGQSGCQRGLRDRCGNQPGRANCAGHGQAVPGECQPGVCLCARARLRAGIDDQPDRTGQRRQGHCQLLCCRFVPAVAGQRYQHCRRDRTRGQ